LAIESNYNPQFKRTEPNTKNKNRIEYEKQLFFPISNNDYRGKKLNVMYDAL